MHNSPSQCSMTLHSRDRFCMPLRNDPYNLWQLILKFNLRDCLGIVVHYCDAFEKIVKLHVIKLWFGIIAKCEVKCIIWRILCISRAVQASDWSDPGHMISLGRTLDLCHCHMDIICMRLSTLLWSSCDADLIAIHRDLPFFSSFFACIDLNCLQLRALALHAKKEICIACLTWVSLFLAALLS